MRAPEDERTIPVPTRTKTTQRRRRLARGLTLWDIDRQLCSDPTRRIARVTLTFAAGEYEAAYGQARHFWARVRRKWLGTRYFCWLELTRAGRAHYHCVWVNPPHLRRVNLLKWVDQAWGIGRTEVRFSDGTRGIDRELSYALGYAKKMGKKSYQQVYEDVPRQLRTFMTQRLDIPPGSLDHAVERDLWTYVGRSAKYPLLTGPHLRYWGRLEHQVERTGHCSALEHRRHRVHPPWSLPPSSSGSPY